MSSEILKLEQVDFSNQPNDVEVKNVIYFSDERVQKLRKKKLSLKKSDVKPDLSDNAIKVIEKRYLLKDKDNKVIEKPIEMFHRVATHVAKADGLYGATDEEMTQSELEFYEMMARLEFLPNSPTFSGAGTELGQLAACFVLPIEDNLKSILKTQSDMGLIQQSGGGTGFSFSRIRPAGSVVRSSGGKASGPISFMQMYNDTTEPIKQGGIRRGANMGILRIDHPDILDFIKYKEEEGTLTTFNISVAVTDKFMKAVKENIDYDLVDPRTKEVVKQLNAREVFDKIVEGAWRNGEPGIIFIDKINAHQPTPNLGQIEATNPCGEQPLLPYESCNLGSINLGRLVKVNARGKNELDWEKLEETVKKAVHLLDNVIDMNHFPIPEIEQMTKTTRKIGLGIMGFADLLFQIDIAYDSEEALALAEKIMKKISEVSHEESQKRGKLRGSFPAFKGSIWDKKGLKSMRNATTTTIAPTGTLSIFATATSGIEPIFALVYTKTVMDGTGLVEINRHFKKALIDAGIYTDELIQKVAESGSVQDLEEIPDNIKKVFVTTRDISPEFHVKMQASFQKHTDNAISKTINFPNEATVEEVEKAYLLAHELDCKGITVYRDGSRNVQVITTGIKKKEGEPATQVESQSIVASGITIVPRERPDVIRGYTYRIKTAYGKLFITINDDENGYPFEVFSHLGKAGGFFAAKAEAICRMMSLALRSGVDPNEIIDQLKGIRGPTPTWSEEGKMILSLPDAIAQILEKHISKEQTQLDLEFKTGEQPTLDSAAHAQDVKIAQENIAMNNGFTEQKSPSSIADLGEAPACPECGGMLEMGEGCLKCNFCGYSKCA